MTSEGPDDWAMALCMQNVVQELIEAGVIPPTTKPISVTEAVLRSIRALEIAANAEAQNADEWRELANQRAEDFKRFQACRHGARAMPEDGGEDAFITAIDKYRTENGLE